MELWVWIIIGVIGGSLVFGLLCYFYMKNKSKILKQDLFDGEAYCYVIQKIKKGSYLGKRKTYPGLEFTKKLITQKHINELHNFYCSEDIRVKDMAIIRQCFKNLANKGIEVPELEEESSANLKHNDDDYEDEEEQEVQSQGPKYKSEIKKKSDISDSNMPDKSFHFNESQRMTFKTGSKVTMEILPPVEEKRMIIAKQQVASFSLKKRRAKKQQQLQEALDENNEIRQKNKEDEDFSDISILQLPKPASHFKCIWQRMQETQVSLA
ncbi:UNKNOWN [Stylonychia lemnae]|uniref:Uncharacterized protein n=1 Tax=Stylonychia lemnae TaxID=5949 RepID=A0A078A9W4_STYLE|nr:UNKNOWN [Stylonychia lemnae]|eukprot:CDW78686.1 UNKNOWN [Stylonychia lemnae]